jgi:L-ascorbate metabolism protein UlaG (beta-lactamase superfamily)
MDCKVKWLGHASFKITTDDVTVYIDPYMGDYKDQADLVLVTHSHSDHCDRAKISRITRKDTAIVAPADCAEKIGKGVISLNPGETREIQGVLVKAVHAYNATRFRSPGVPFHPKGVGVGYLLTVDDKIIYHCGDTDFIPEMKEIETVDLVLLPSGGTYTMDNPEAAEATLSLKPKAVVPMHRWDTDPAEFRNDVEKAGVTDVVLLTPGEEYVLP